MYVYENRKKPIQRREINGTITRTAVAPDADGRKLVTQARTNPTNVPLLNLYTGNGHNRKKLLTEHGFITENVMRAHLVKCAWDGGNDKDRVTQWRKESEEVAWTGYEENVQNAAALFPANAVIDVKTVTDDPNLGNTLLGNNAAAFNSLHPNAHISTKQHSDAKEELNRQIATATISLRNQAGDWEAINTINCPNCVNITLNPNIDNE